MWRVDLVGWELGLITPAKCCDILIASSAIRTHVILIMPIYLTAI